MFNSFTNYFKQRYRFIKDFREFKLRLKNQRFNIDWKDRYPCLFDKTTITKIDRHYVYHTAWAARAVAKIRPELHIDISSYIYFSTLVSAFIPVKFYDYRPVILNLDNLSSESADLLALPFGDRSVKSISCMHVVEHIGLGRYGDPIDPDGDLKAIKELKRVLAPGGSILFVLPVGKPKIMFNAHRIYSYSQVLEYFSDFDLIEFALIPDQEEMVGLIINASKEMADRQSYACGCFWFMRKYH